MKLSFFHILVTVTLFSCSDNKGRFDATGTFEATEVIVASEASGKLLTFNLEEGQLLKGGQKIGAIDSTQLFLTKLQLRENQKAVLAGKPDIKTQMESIKKEIESTLVEKKRIETLVKGEVANQKQLDDIDSKLAVLEAKLAAQQNSLRTITSTLNEQSNAINVNMLIVQDQLKKCNIINPIEGTVLTKYAMQNEMTVPGKALYKIADLSTLILRAYISASQLSLFKLGQPVDVLVDAAEGQYKTYKGTITWVSDTAEFTPKTIQTKEERANLVYAIKIAVKNDDFLKIGMYGEVMFN